MDRLFIIGGCNVVGKTTASKTILPEILECREFINADEIAYALSPTNPEAVAMMHQLEEQYEELKAQKRAAA